MSLMLLAATSIPRSAQAAIVTMSGSGVLDRWVIANGDGPVPPQLLALFPLGTTFTATATYDTDQVDQAITYDEGYTAYWGAVTDASSVVSGHQLTQRADGGAVYVVDGGDGSWDMVQCAAAAYLDGNASFDGYHIDTVFSMYDSQSSPISSVELPLAMCPAAWEELVVAVVFFTPEHNYRVVGYGSPDRSVDSDDDGVSDGVELLHACIDGCAGDTDSDGDTVLDRVEIVQTGSDPCGQDTDGDGVLDGVDPDPLVPGVSEDQLTEMVRDTSIGVLDIPEGAFEGNNANAERGRRNALSNKLQAAANELEAGHLEEALQILTHVHALLDGDPSPADVMEDGPEKDALIAEVDALIAYLEAQISG
jgi:hypothetical protein